MNLYTNGCSFTAGTIIDQSLFGTKKIGRPDCINWTSFCKKGQYGTSDYFDTIVNQAIEGGSNHRLFRQTTEFINKTDNLEDWIFVIQLTHPERFEVFYEKYGAWIGVIKDMHFTEDRVVQESTDVEKDVEDFFDRIIMPTVFTRTEFEGIFELYNMLNTFIELCKHKKLKYLITAMSNTCMPNVFESSGRDDQPFNGLDFPVFDSSNLILPISNIARENIIHQSDPHPNEIGHSLVSRYIINEIEKRWQI
tara:strand:- start:120 stop:872 length:753 start_codon:yes stop_codon:yes gene_type:complete